MRAAQLRGAGEGAALHVFRAHFAEVCSQLRAFAGGAVHGHGARARRGGQLRAGNVFRLDVAEVGGKQQIAASDAFHGDLARIRTDGDVAEGGRRQGEHHLRRTHLYAEAEVPRGLFFRRQPQQAVFRRQLRIAEVVPVPVYPHGVGERDLLRGFIRLHGDVGKGVGNVDVFDVGKGLRARLVARGVEGGKVPAFQRHAGHEQGAGRQQQRPADGAAYDGKNFASRLHVTPPFCRR